MTEESALMPEEAASSIVLRGRAIDVPVRSLSDPSSTEQVGIIFDCNVLADLEENFNDGYAGYLRYDEDEFSDEQDTNDDGTPKVNAKGEPVYKLLHAAGTKRTGEDGKPIRESFYGVEAWQSSMLDRPFYTLRMTMALSLGLGTRETGQRMIEENLPDYFTAVGAAFAIANGVDPTDALKMAVEQMERQKAELLAVAGSAPASESPETEPTADTPGTTGSEPGVEPGDLSTSSGT